jgi:hypothetical protein
MTVLFSWREHAAQQSPRRGTTELNRLTRGEV